MPSERAQILRTAQLVFDEQNRELQAERQRQMQAVAAQTATGSTDIDATFGLDRKFRLAFVRCHFSGNPGTAALTLSMDAASGSAYDTHLFTVTKAGTGHDVNFRITAEESAEPSPWTFQADDRLHVEWTNPDSGNITWGLEVGLAVAS